MSANDVKYKEDFIKVAKKADFIQLVLVDINGIPRVKILPSDAAEKIAEEGDNSVLCTLGLGVDGTVAEIEGYTKRNYGNVPYLPIYETTRNWPWWNVSSKTQAIQVFTQPQWPEGGYIEADPRSCAVAQLKRLHDRGYDMYWGTECEFRLFEKSDSETGELIPAHKSLHVFYHPLVAQYEPIYTEMNRRMRALGFTFDAFHSEYGFGQVEFVLSADWGIKHADDLIRFKMLAKDIARENGYRASFMAKSLPSQNGSGYHLNHSVWKRKDGKAVENVMLDTSDEHKMSKFSKHWLAGLLHHSNAMTAITSPTVNCYRRMHNPWCPSYIDWGVDNRFVSFRFKDGGKPNSTYLENRCPSSASNPYLTLAATIAAGLDGVDRELTLVPDGSKDMGPLPHDLSEALEAFQKDEVFNKTFGDDFVDWFTKTKKVEIEKLRDVDVRQERDEDFVRERKLYFDSV